VVSVGIIFQLLPAIVREHVAWKDRLWIAGLCVLLGAVAYVLPRL
jgi:hypothetical protein